MHCKLKFGSAQRSDTPHTRSSRARPLHKINCRAHARAWGELGVGRRLTAIGCAPASLDALEVDMCS
eukprot:788234-Pleurochrysis_carterae.AAC.1